MDKDDFITIFNIVAPHVFGYISRVQTKNPGLTPQQIYQQAGITLDNEYLKLLGDMQKAVEEGAVPNPAPPA